MDKERPQPEHEERALTGPYHQLNLKEVQMTFIVPGLKPPKLFGQKQEKKPVCLTYFKGGLSLEMIATVEEKKGRKKNIVHKYKRVIRQFPSAVDRNRSTYKIKKGEIQVLLHKKEEIDWEPYLKKNGLDQLDSSEESPDEEIIGGAAAAPKPKPESFSLDELASGFTTLYEVSSPTGDSSDGRKVTRVISSTFTRHGQEVTSEKNTLSSKESRKRSMSEEVSRKHVVDEDDPEEDGGPCYEMDEIKISLN